MDIPAAEHGGAAGRALRGLAVFLSLLATPLPALAAPAFWVCRDTDSTVWMLGTIHLMDGDRPWATETVDAAFQAADELWLEIDLLEDTSAGFFALSAAGTTPDRRLTGRLTEAETADLERLAAAAGLEMRTLEPLRPWLASVTLTVEFARRAGLDAKGVDLQLAERARDAGKPTSGFETGADQLAVFAGISEPAELALFRQTLEELKTAPKVFEDLIGSWYDGDVERMIETTRASIDAAGPEVRDKLLVRRNRLFADRIAAMMEGSGTHFVAVGAAHLVGDDSVQSFLAERGIETERLQ